MRCHGNSFFGSISHKKLRKNEFRRHFLTTRHNDFFAEHRRKVDRRVLFVHEANVVGGEGVEFGFEGTRDFVDRNVVLYGFVAHLYRQIANDGFDSVVEGNERQFEREGGERFDVFEKSGDDVSGKFENLRVSGVAFEKRSDVDFEHG